MQENGARRLIKKRSLYRDEIHESIKEAILSGELKPGDRIVETRWAKELGVSQSPVREAIRELEIIGLVENRPFQGSYVKELTLKDIKDSYRVRMSLEVLGITDAIVNMTEEQLEEIYKVMKEMETAGENHDFDLYIKKDTLFHQMIMEASNNSTLLRLWSQCYIREWTYINTKKLSDVGLERLAVRHEAIYNSLKARDSKMAVQAITTHFEELIEQMEAARQ